MNDTSTSPNWGCRGTTAALKTLIERQGGHVSSTIFLHDMFKREQFQVSPKRLIMDTPPKTEKTILQVLQIFRGKNRFFTTVTA